LFVLIVGASNKILKLGAMSWCWEVGAAKLRKNWGILALRGALKITSA